MFHLNDLIILIHSLTHFLVEAISVVQETHPGTGMPVIHTVNANLYEMPSASLRLQWILHSNADMEEL